MKKNIFESENESAPYDEKILSLLILGFSQEKISIILKLDQKHIKRRKAALVRKGLITESIINYARINRERKAEQRRKYLIDEEKQEDDGFIETAEMHIKYCKAKLLLDEIEKINIDVDILSDLILMHSELMTPRNINYVLTAYIRLNKPHVAVKYINECNNLLEEDEEQRKKLLEARDSIKYYLKKKKAKSMLKSGFVSADDIAREVGITGREVREIKAQMENEIELPEIKMEDIDR